MKKKELLSKLTTFANQGWNRQITHGFRGVVDDGYPCANPNGPVDNSDCEESDPLCNCPCQELKPDSFEPTDEEIKEVENSIKECDLIKEQLGEEWLGCLWNKLDHPSSCNCPCVGEKFKDYLKYNRTYSTYWDTSPKQPLWREAQLALLNSQSATMMIHGDFTLRPGELIYILDTVHSSKDNKIQLKRHGGRWMVVNIDHLINPISHDMIVTLMRDSTTTDPNINEEITLEDLWGWITTSG